MSDPRTIEQDVAKARAYRDSVAESARSKPESAFHQLALASAQARVADLEEELRVAKLESSSEIFELKLEGLRVDQGEVPLRLLAVVADRIDKAFTNAAFFRRVGQDSYQLDENTQRELDLKLAATERGSTRLLFRGDTRPDLDGYSALSEALRDTFEVLNADSERLPEAAAGIGPKATNELAILLKELSKAGSTVELKWCDAEQNPYSWKANNLRIGQLCNSLESLASEKVDEISVEGWVDLLARTGRITVKEASTGQKIAAHYNRTLAKVIERNYSLGDRVKCVFQRHTYTPGNSDRPKYAHQLLRISKLEDSASDMESDATEDGR